MKSEENAIHLEKRKARMYPFILLISCWCVSAFAKSGLFYSLENAERHFDRFITKYHKRYADEEEKQVRFEIFKKHLEKVNRLNRENEHAVHGVTKFADLTTEEFIGKYTGHLGSDEPYCDIVKKDDDIEDPGAPEAFDWRDRNAVTRVKKQAHCGSCFAFSTTGHIESQYFIVKNQTLTEFSEQQILDCDSVSHGCRGGYMSNAIKALIKLGGPMTEEDYQYEMKQGKCRSDRNKVQPKIVQCITYDLTSQEKLKQVLYKVGPIAVSFAAPALQGYKKGIVKDIHCTGEVNHAVLLVGYGSEKERVVISTNLFSTAWFVVGGPDVHGYLEEIPARNGKKLFFVCIFSNFPTSLKDVFARFGFSEKGVDYWILKNSWGPGVGEKGYFRLQRSNNPDGACGILNTNMATAVVV